MAKGKGKVIYEVQDQETIDDCLERIKKDGYVPVRRTEKPVFEEYMENGKKSYKPVTRQIIFEAKRMD